MIFQRVTNDDNREKDQIKLKLRKLNVHSRWYMYKEQISNTSFLLNIFVTISNLVVNLLTSILFPSV
jgi:hypothetical protein